MSLEIKEHAELETDSLAQVADVVRAAVAWKVKPKQLGRKLSSVRFAAQSYQRYLERLFAIEEHDGYMDAVLQGHPHRTEQIDELRRKHEEFRKTIRRITTHLDHLHVTDHGTFENLCHELIGLVKHVEHHNAHEMAILQEAFSQDLGGEA